MSINHTKIPCVLMRGGTSRGLIFKDTDLPLNFESREQLILKIYGSSPSGQIDGIGGGTSVTSKVAVVGITDQQDCDIYYDFGQVGIKDRTIDRNVTCGNMASAVGLYAVEEGLVEKQEGETKVRILNTNTDKVMEVSIPVKQGEIENTGDFAISGVDGTGAKINVSFMDASGAFTGKLFPTGNLVDEIIVDQKTYEVSILDTGNIVAFVKAYDFGLNGHALSGEINLPHQLDAIEQLRVQVGIKLGIFKENQTVNPASDALPKITLVNEPVDYITEIGTLNNAEDIDIIGRYISMGKLHPSFAVSGAICLATACQIPGTVPYTLCKNHTDHTINIGHPNGSIEADIFLQHNESGYYLEEGSIGRTARRIMEGHAVVPNTLTWEGVKL
ncbi:PrpF domain-containing protein [Mammaliicoccus sp. Dog046]|uniref:PrpF domain-containing protein n=1 Tax=Mammaliicoccus sp. Dog046 TaxID=3034233 RepID=UPI002B25A348|nr:PrpF domain-containing protein [Mammaliicoccus sp. Dog046]WQK85606.1 PrpF domain-containing protein [Mammaliicoccus sp. Dog046]